MKRRPARAKMIAELFETFMAILHSEHTKWLEAQIVYMLEVNETTGNPTDFKSPRQMDAQCRKRRRFELETT